MTPLYTTGGSYYFNHLDKVLDFYNHYDKKLLVGDFNTKVSDNVLSTLLYQHYLESLVKDETCFKNAINPSTIDLILTSNFLAFQNTATTFTGLSDCQKLVLTVFKKVTFSKNNPKKLIYRDFKTFSFSDFNDDLKAIFSRNTVGSCYQFDQTFLNVLEKHAPLKRKLPTANHLSYISKILPKAIVRRSYYEKFYCKTKLGKKL